MTAAMSVREKPLPNIEKGQSHSFAVARVFDQLGYRRCAWQCNSLNSTSHATAKRLGFTFEGALDKQVS